MKKIFCNNRGFTLIELILVIAIISVMSVIALPKLSAFLGSGREDLVLLVSYLSAITDDSYINRKTNFLSIQLNDLNTKDTEYIIEPNIKRNSITVYELTENLFRMNKNKMLSRRNFDTSLIFQYVKFDDGKTVTSGEVIIPFYSDASSEGFILGVLNDNKKIDIRKSKNVKNVQVENKI